MSTKTKTKETRTEAPAKKERIKKTSDEALERCMDCLEDARKTFIDFEGVIGVGYGNKETAGKLLEDQPSIIIYVVEKKPEKALSKKESIPKHFHGVPTDLVVPGHRAHPRHNGIDSMWIDWGKVHALNPAGDVNMAPSVDSDIDDVAVLEIDDSFVTSGKIDWAKATKRFLLSHPDAFDFVAFFVDTSSGLPGQGSFHSGIYNKTKGINYYAGDNLDQRSAFGTSKLQAFLSLSGFSNYVMLQEFGHMWGAFVRNRDTASGSLRYDLLIGSSGQGKFHWGRFFDNQHSAMDYDRVDWQALGGNYFQSHGIGDDYFHFCPLDLYLMGLTPKSQVGTFYVIQNPSANSGTITGTRKNITTQNVIWAEGTRDPAYPSTQKDWKVAFVALTKDASSAGSFVGQVADQRREFTWQAYKGTRFLGRVDTTLSSVMVFPEIRDIAVSVDDDSVIIGWKTNVSTRSRVNYATTSGAFSRDQAHSEPFMTVSETDFGVSHGVRIDGLTPNRMYYFEIVAENPRGNMDREGLEQFYTRKTCDVCPPDINNVNVSLLRIWNFSKVRVGWKTNEPADGTVLYGKSVPPSSTRHDPYPSTDHNFTLSGVSAGTYYISVRSEDAAGNVTVDDNNGNHYQITVPSTSLSPFGAVAETEISERTLAINELVKEGDTAGAIEQTSQFILEVGSRELTQIVELTAPKGEDLEVGLSALKVMADRLGTSLDVVRLTTEAIDIKLDPDPLRTMSCVDLPEDIVAERCGPPVLSDVVASVRKGLTLEPHPNLGVGYYRLRQKTS